MLECTNKKTLQYLVVLNNKRAVKIAFKRVVGKSKIF